MKYVLSIDQSTQCTKALLFDDKGFLLCRSDKSHQQIIDNNGWVEHNSDEIYDNLICVVKDIVSKANIGKKDITVVGISNQRETGVAWDKSTGKPIYNAIVWQCARGESICTDLSQHKAYVKNNTGLTLSPYFTGAKISWIIKNVPNAREKSTNNELCYGTMDSWLIYKLTKGKSYKTDYSNASRTQLFNIIDLQWDKKICDLFEINIDALPEVCDSNSNFGLTDFDGFLDTPIPIHCVLGDSHGALFGQGCLEKGMVKATYGTGSSVMMNIGDTPIFNENIVTSLAWSMNGKVNYVLEGNINYTGAIVSWLKDDVELINNPAETAQCAKKADKKDKTYFVPAFTGLGAPYWDSNATGLFTGITRITGKNEIVKASIDSIAYQITDIVEIMIKESKVDKIQLKTDGGPTKNDYLMQFQSDMINNDIFVSDVEEISGVGVAYGAGLATNMYDKEIFNNITNILYAPNISIQERNEKYNGWKNAINMATLQYEFK